MASEGKNMGVEPSIPRPEADRQSAATQTAAWEGGKCRVPMWMAGSPAGFCDEQAFGPQLPMEILRLAGWPDRPYCHGPCCPKHGGPREGEEILFTDGWTDEGRPMWCAVMPDFVNLQESPAGFDGDPRKARANLRAAIAKATARATLSQENADD